MLVTIHQLKPGPADLAGAAGPAMDSAMDKRIGLNARAIDGCSRLKLAS